jgi:hypothetical protein
LTRLPILQREIRIGEPLQTCIPAFGMIAWQGHDQSHDTDVSDRIVDILGVDAATWLRTTVHSRWRLVRRQHRPSHPRAVVRETLLLFTNAADAEEFAWRFNKQLQHKKLGDLEMRQIEHVGHLRQTVAGGFYDPSRCSMPAGMKRIKRLLDELRELRERQQEIDLLRHSLELDLRKEWCRLWRTASACAGSISETDAEPPAGGNLNEVLSRYEDARRALKAEVDAGAYDPSRLPEAVWADVAQAFLGRARGVRRLYRRINRLLMASGQRPSKERTGW